MDYYNLEEAGSLQMAQRKCDNMALIGRNDEEKIWNFLYSKLKNPYGVAGIMGNMYAESGLKSTNLQQSYEKKLGFTDESYTNAVDNGTYNNFIYDKAGYGLVQWTYWSLKRELYNYCLQKKTSIGDLEMQLELICEQLSKSYKTTVWDICLNAKSVLEASNAMLLKFERPADQSEKVQQKRASYGQKYFNKYVNLEGNNTTIINNQSYCGAGIGTAVARQEMNVRTTPSTDGAILSSIKKGTAVEVLEITLSGWYKIVWPGIKTGYAYVSNRTGQYFGYTPKTFKIEVTANALNIRSGIGVSNNIVGLLKKGNQVLISKVEDNWGYIKDRNGWISLTYTKRV